MFSYFKLKIIFWYTFLLVIILASSMYVSNRILEYQIKEEIYEELEDRVENVEQAIRDSLDSQRNSRRRKLSKTDRIINRRRDFTFYDVRQFTEMADENCILFIYINDELIHLSEDYEDIGLEIEQFKIPDGRIDHITINNIPFCLAALNNKGFTVYVGYDLSSINELAGKQIQIFIIVLPISILLSVICGYLVTQRSMNVVKKINNTAASITSNNLSERIELPKGKDEISALIGTLNSMINRLEKSFNQSRQFSHDAAHEIRTPLTIIQGEIEQIIEGNATPEEISLSLDNMVEEIRYISKMANKLLLIHSMDTSNIKYPFEKIDLSGILDEIFQDAKILSSEKKLVTELNKNDKIHIEGNRGLLIRLFWNVIDNAVKYNKPEGSINIELETADNQVHVIILDTGIGIPEDEIPKIFDRFYRVEKSRSRELGGSGLGLAICKWIVELHNGVITVESEPEKGSKFIIALPM